MSLYVNDACPDEFEPANDSSSQEAIDAQLLRKFCSAEHPGFDGYDAYLECVRNRGE